MGGGGPKNTKTTTTPIVPPWLSEGAQGYLGNIQDLTTGFMSGQGPGYDKFTEYVNRVQEPTIENYTNPSRPRK